MELVKDTAHRGRRRSPACSVCGKTFSSRFKLKRHFMIHTGEKPYACSVCNMRFNQASILKGHMRRHEEQSTKQTTTATQAKVKACTKNPRNSSSNTKTAVKSQNPKVLKPLSSKNIPQKNKVSDKVSKRPNYECPLCRMGFMHSANLQRHMNVHASSIQGPVSTHKVDKRHECPLCGMKFGLVTNLQNHMSIHSAELENDTHHCPFCSKKFTSQSGFIRHQRSHFLIEDEAHAGEKSERCETHQVGADEEEVKSDKDAEQYTCCLCGVKFDSVLDICNHMQTHCSQESQPCLTEQDNPDDDDDDDDESMPYLEQKGPAAVVADNSVPCLTVQNNPDDDECMPELTEHYRPNVAEVDDGEKALRCLIVQDEHDVEVTNSQQKSMPYLTELDGPNVVMIDGNHRSMPCLTVQHGSDAASGIETVNKEATENGTLKEGERIDIARDILTTDSMKLYCMNYIEKEESQKCKKQPRIKVERNIFEVANLMKDTLKKEQSDTPAIKNHSQKKDQASRIMNDPQNAAERNHHFAYIQVPVVRTMRMKGRFKTSSAKQNWNPAEGNNSVMDAAPPEIRQVNESLKQATGAETHNHSKEDKLNTVGTSTATNNVTKGKVELPHKNISVYYKCGLCSYIFGSAALRDRHMKVHLVKKLLKCMPCGNLFVDSASLLAHLKTNSKCAKELNKVMNPQSHLTTHLGDKKETSPLDGNSVPASPVSTILQTPGTEVPAENTCTQGETQPGLEICTENEVTELQTHAGVAVCLTENSSIQDKRDTASDEETTDQIDAESHTPDWEPVCAAEDATCTEEESHSGWEVCMDQDSSEAEDVEVMDAEWELHVDDEADPNSTSANSEDTWANTYSDVKSEHMHHAFRICGDEVTVLPKTIKEDSAEMTETDHRAELAQTRWPTIRSQLSTGGFGSLSDTVSTRPVHQSCVKIEHHRYAEHHQCAECGDRFDSVSDLRQHDQEHQGKKAYQCSVCDKRFYEPGALIVHSRSHTQEDYTRIQQQEIDAARIQQQEIDAARIQQQEIDAARIQQQEIDAARIQQQEIDAARIQQQEIDAARIQQQEIDAARIQQQEIDAAKIQQQEIDAVRIQQQEIDAARIQKQEIDEAMIMRLHDHQLPETEYTIQSDEAEPVGDMNTKDTERPHNCSICGKEITPSARDVQLKSRKCILLKCTECYDRFYKHRVDGNAKKRTHTEATSHRKRAIPKLHTRLKHEEEQGAMKCVQCGAGFDDLTHFSAHMEKHRQEKAENSEPKQRTTERYYCSECGEHFKYMFILKAHMKTHSKEECYKCPYCDVPFSSSSDLSRHILQHTGEKFYRCALCKMTFYKSTELNQHVLLHHSTEGGKRPYECSHCGRRFASAGVVTLHIKSHIQDAQFKCSHCEKRFDTKAELTDHNETHVEVRPVTCYACNATFTRWDYLKRHVTTIHRNYQEQVCPYCGDYCTDAKTINEHLRSHAAEKNHVCSVCGEKFVFCKLLRRHMKKVHTVKEVHRCVHCNCTFTKPTALKNHMVYSHKNIKQPAKSHHKVKTPGTDPTDKKVKTPGNDGGIKVKTAQTDRTEESVETPDTDSTDKNVKTAETHSTEEQVKTLYNDCGVIKVEKPDNISRDKVKIPESALTDNKVTTPHNDGSDIKVKPAGNDFTVKSQDNDNKEVSNETKTSRNAAPKVRTAGRSRLQCTYCHKKFILRRKLNQHVRDRQLMGGVCSTPVRGMVCSSPVQHPPVPVTHLKPHTSYSQCGACIMGFSQSVYLEKHLAAHADVL